MTKTVLLGVIHQCLTRKDSALNLSDFFEFPNNKGQFLPNPACEIVLVDNSHGYQIVLQQAGRFIALAASNEHQAESKFSFGIPPHAFMKLEDRLLRTRMISLRSKPVSGWKGNRILCMDFTKSQAKTWPPNKLSLSILSYKPFLTQLKNVKLSWVQFPRVTWSRASTVEAHSPYSPLGDVLLERGFKSTPFRASFHAAQDTAMLWIEHLIKKPFFEQLDGVLI